MKKHRRTINNKKQKASVIIITLILLISLPVQVHALTYYFSPKHWIKMEVSASTPPGNRQWQPRHQLL